MLNGSYISKRDTWRRLMRRGVILFAALAGLFAVSLTPAAQAAPDTAAPTAEAVRVADPALFSSPPSGNVGESAGGKATANQIWDRDWDSFTVKISAPTSLATSYCAGSFFDWDRQALPGTSDHMDARVAASCKTGTSKGSGSQDDAGLTFWGAQKLAGCYGHVNNLNNGSCTNHSSAPLPIGGSTISLNGPCAEVWAVWADGSSYYNSGGNRTSCTD